jgi:hypothetical protein
MAELWVIPSLQANYGSNRPPICQLSLHRYNLESLKEWLGLQGIYPRQWNGLNIKEWWSLLAEGSMPHRKALASLTLLTVWEIWIERNARVLHDKQSPSFVIVDKIKQEARLWVLQGVAKLGSIMLGE